MTLLSSVKCVVYAETSRNCEKSNQTCRRDTALEQEVESTKIPYVDWDGRQVTCCWTVQGVVERGKETDLYG